MSGITMGSFSFIHSKLTLQSYFMLADLWESFKEWSAFGARAPLILNDSDDVVQYYVPYVSDIQIYNDSMKSPEVKEEKLFEYYVDSRYVVQYYVAYVSDVQIYSDSIISPELRLLKKAFQFFAMRMSL
ncbi:hypothetical protein IFM89_035768 [Coptis chinensis]|uniref:Uncharacterized protein n=1 Tax=Coptis chinensis TaxID=261450 RepID=A0A835LXD6_9MAGN|nr:hypothetical protein IFM89_035768 [Coptis chinensis]